MSDGLWLMDKKASIFSIVYHLSTINFTCGLPRKGQVTTEYVLATLLFMGIFVWFYGITQDALKKMYKNAAFVILTSYR